MKVEQFTSPAAAFRWASNCIKSHFVLLGDNGKFWVANFATAQKLEKQGYTVLTEK